jgi:hypothetical protein
VLALVVLAAPPASAAERDSDEDPQSAIAARQSPIPNPQSPVFNPQSPVASPQSQSYELARQAREILQAGPKHAFGSRPEAEGWLGQIIDARAAAESKALHDTIRVRKQGLGIPEDRPEESLSADEKELLQGETGRFRERLHKVYEPVLAAKTLAEKLTALHPKADKTAEPDDLTLEWLKRRVLEYIRLYDLAQFPALDGEAVAREIQVVFDLGPRTVGHQGHRAVRDHVAGRFRAAGLSPVLFDTFVRAAPVDHGATITTGGVPVVADGRPHLFAMWPNQAMPSTLPDGGLEGPLAWMGSGRLVEADGQPMDGAVVLMEFKSGASWQWAAMLGARAVIFLDGPGMSREEAADKFISLPVAFPRYYADAVLSERLRALAKSGARVRLEGKMRWQNVQCANVLGLLPATALRETHETLRRELAEAGDQAPGVAGPADLERFLAAPICEWPPGLVAWALRRHLKIEERQTYPGRVADLLKRLSAARQAVLVVAPLDSMACAPAAPHGADQSAALVALEALAEYLSRGSPLVRSRSVVFLAADSQFQSQYGARSLARAILRGKKHFRDEAADYADQIEEVTKVQAILADPFAFDYSRDGQAQALLKGDLKAWMNSRRIDVVTSRRELEGERTAREKEAGHPLAKSLDEVAEEIRLAYYKAAGAIRPLSDLLAAMALAEGPAGAKADLEAALGPLADLAKAADLTAIVKAIEKANSRRKFKALPAPVLAALRAAIAPEDVTLSYARRRYEARLQSVQSRLSAAEEDGRLADVLTGLGKGEDVAKLLADFKKAPGDAALLAKAEALLARIVREDQYDVRIAFCVDLASHSTQITLGRGSTAMAGGGMPGSFNWTILPNLSQRFAKSGDLYNEVLRLDRKPLFVDTCTSGVGRLHTPTQGSSPVGPLSLAGITPYPLTTAEDLKFQWNTPADVPARADPGRLSVQIKTLAALVAEVLADESLLVEVKRIQSKETDIFGRIVKFDIRAGPFPNMPVPEALVYLVRGGNQDRGGKGAGATGGVLTPLAVLADSDGNYFMPLEQRDGSGQATLWAYGFNEALGQINLAIDEAESQTVRLTNRPKLRDPTERRDLLVFDCAGVTVFDPVDPRYLRQLRTMQVLDGHGKSQPRHFAVLGLDQTKGKAGDADPKANCAVAFVPPKINVQIMMGEKELGARRFVLLGTTDQEPTGEGYPAGRGRLMTETPLAVARDMVRLNGDRLARMGLAGIRSTKLDDLAARAAECVRGADEARRRFRYADAVRLANAAWGYAARAYPAVTDTANDAVYGVVFFLVLLLPFAYFLERLTFKAKTAVYRVVGMSVWFAVFFVVLVAVHPAFRISGKGDVAFIILLAFMLLVMSSVVLVLVSARFGEQVKKWRQEAAGVHSADVSRLSTAAVAFNLGIANLGKRKSRTVLTVATLILLAFSVISFTSIQQAADYLPIRLGAEAPYDGLFFRMPYWKDMPDSIITSLEVEFEGRHTVVRRGWKMEVEGGWGQWGIHANEIPLVRADQPDRKAIVMCLAGFEAAEKDLTHLDRCLAAGRWMESGEDDVIILPVPIAEQLGITAEDVERAVPGRGLPRLVLEGRTFAVIGLFDVAKMDAIRDLNGEPLSAIDYMASGSEGGLIGAGGVGGSGIESEVGTERAFEHLKFGVSPWAIAPLATIRQMSHSHVKAIAVKFAPGPREDHEHFVDELMGRLAINVYAGLGGERFLIRAVGFKTIRPDWTLVAPIILAVLIILNTMLGTVEERKGEIGMLGAVGLAPRHVAMLFFTEASVYANAGVVVGYLVGQVMAKLVVSLGLFQELSLNYSSLAALFTAVLVAGIVLAATVYPARKAAALATPSGAARWAMPQPRAGRRLSLDLPFTLTRGNAVGMARFLHEYFEAHSDPTSPDFSTTRLRARARLQRGPGEAVDGQALLVLQMLVYPAPYDLGVSQRCRVVVYPTGRRGVYGVRFSLRRLSSDEGSWMRTNFRFLDLIRKQFLIWRTIRLDQRQSYIERGLELFP